MSGSDIDITEPLTVKYRLLVSFATHTSKTQPDYWKLL